MEAEERIRYAIENTKVLRSPKQTLATFGITNIHYYLVTEPIYTELLGKTEETVVREGTVIAERPKIVTPSYLVNLFDGFEHGQEYAQYMRQRYSPHELGLLYRYKNELRETNILSTSLETVVLNLNQQIDSEGNSLAAIIKGVDEMWDVSLMKFIHDITQESLQGNVREMGMRGFLNIDRSGIPSHAKYAIEQLFEAAGRDRSRVTDLEAELRRWGLFKEYEDRFLDLFRKR